MEISRIARGGNTIAYIRRVGLALGIAAIASVGVRIISKNKRNPQERGGWTELDFNLGNISEEDS